MEEHFLYWMYGLCVQTPFALPEVYPAGADVLPDVIVTVGNVPDIVKKKLSYEEARVSFQNKKAWFYGEGAGLYYVEDGSRIIIEPFKENDWNLIHAMLLGAGMGHIFAQRGILAFHGSCVAFDHNSLLISGDSGAGKSTITHELMKRASRFLADDTVVIHFHEDKPYSVPGYPQQKICRDLAEREGYDVSKLVLLNEEREKYALNKKECYSCEEARLSLIVMIEKSDVPQVMVKELKGREKLNVLMDNIYLHKHYEMISLGERLMSQLLCLAKTTRVIRITRPAKADTVVEISEKLYQAMEAEI